MLDFLKREANKTYTENGAITYASTYSDCLDFFATAGALRNADEAEIISRFMRAYTENRLLAMKLIFFTRDVRGGLGERRVFRVVMKWLSEYECGSVTKNINHIAEFGRFDDIVALINTPCREDAISYIRRQLEDDIASAAKGENISLLVKWLPSVNASNAETVKTAKTLARALDMTDEQYRKTLSKLRGHIHILENNLREKDYTFDYEKQPSKALYKYRDAFLRNDGERYNRFLNRVVNGEAKLNTSLITPYDIIAPFFGSNVTDEGRRAIDVSWNAQEDFTNGENALVVIDGSGSMYGGGKPLPACVALSLGIYFAERNSGVFKDHFITFSETPQLVEIKGGDILDKLRYCHDFNEVANTDISKVFELILNTALKYRVPQKDMPQTLYIISDMEFDWCADNAAVTNFEYAKKKFERSGYKLPRVVFWNVASRNRQQPVTQNEQGAILVSGCSPRVFGMIKSGNLSPYAFMLEVLDSERYSVITA